MCDQVRMFMRRCNEGSIAFKGTNYSSELSFGVAIGTRDQFVAVVEFTAEDLLLMGELGITLSVAAYPSSDDDSDFQQPSLDKQEDLLNDSLSVVLDEPVGVSEAFQPSRLPIGSEVGQHFASSPLLNQSQVTSESKRNSDKKADLDSLVIGDVVHAAFTHEVSSDGGPSLICLITEIKDDYIMARTVTTQVLFRFERTTGRSISNEPSIYRSKTGCPLVALIDSIAPLPSTTYNAILSLDRHMRLALFKSASDRTYLLEEHKHALNFVDSFYKENPF